jgi:hypothetical protein
MNFFDQAEKLNFSRIGCLGDKYLTVRDLFHALFTQHLIQGESLKFPYHTIKKNRNI